MTFVYVSNAGDGTIGLYTLGPDGTLRSGPRFDAGPTVMPMCVSPDGRYLYAAVRSRPYAVITYAIDHATGALARLATAPLAESLPYITADGTGRWLLGASYAGNLVSVNAIGPDGRAAGPVQVLPTGRHAHAIVIDRANRYVFVPHLGTDQVFQFRLDTATGRLTANTPPVVQLTPRTGPRHLVMSPDNRFAYLLNELVATVTVLAHDATTGLLTELGSVSALPADTPLVPGVPGGPGAAAGDRATAIWASDLHVTPDGRFLYAAERASSAIGAFRVDPATGRLTYLASTPVEQQPRGFRIDPGGRHMVVSGERSATISAYAIDGATGALTLVDRSPTGQGSNWVEIVRAG